MKWLMARTIDPFLFSPMQDQRIADAPQLSQKWNRKTTLQRIRNLEEFYQKNATFHEELGDTLFVDSCH